MVPTSTITSPFFAETWRTAGMDAPPGRKIPYYNFLFTNSTGPEELGDFCMVALQRPAQSCRVELLVTQREVCAVVDQKLHHRLVTMDGGPVQAGSAEEASTIDVSAFLQQKLCHLNVTVAGGNV